MTEPFQILQININSARDLAPVCRSMNTYAVGWVNPNRKLTTRVDHKGNNAPEWNDRFTFRVSPKLLESESATFDIEIYSQAWLRDILVGSVRVSIANLLPESGPSMSARRSVALQIRRPSGRPQGILNITVSVLDGTRQSMPLSGVGVHKDTQPKPEREGSIVLRRSKSEHSWTAAAEQEAQAHNRITCKGPEPSPPPAGSLGGSMVNSDVGPSASVVAAAVARGLYLPPTVAARATQGRKFVVDDGESSILQWQDEESDEGIRTKIERWKMELSRPSPSNVKGDPMAEITRNKAMMKHRRAKTEGGRLFRCFGKAYGFEFTIVCGSGNDKKNNKNGKKKTHHTTLSDSSSDSNTQSYIIL